MDCIAPGEILRLPKMPKRLKDAHNHMFLVSLMMMISIALVFAKLIFDIY